MTTIRRSVTTAGAATLLAALALTGCAQEEPTVQEPTTSTEESSSTEPEGEATQTSEAPAEEAEQTETAAATDEQETTSEPETLELASTDDDFGVTLPAGWEDVTEVVDDESVVLAAKQTERVDDFFTNVVITKEEYVGNLTSAVENTAKELAGEDGEYEILDAAEVDGNKAPGYTLVRDVQGTTVHQTQRWISHEGTLYVVTFSAVETQAEAAAPELDDILSSWTWTD